ncbi:hypothetical protein [Candidatus Nitrotoga sp. HW29]|uniref:hypothetical protein n=1 Tax=Candidatus Nitrotoga sp. HW29 TaxID=2886963 RepID=UPI001EF178A3|nr:hypothetical protein [Candidatus Nitrotoga sp. HW29]
MNKILLSQIMKHVPWDFLGHIFDQYGGDAIITHGPYAFFYHCVAFMPKSGRHN